MKSVFKNCDSTSFTEFYSNNTTMMYNVQHADHVHISLMTFYVPYIQYAVSKNFALSITPQNTHGYSKCSKLHLCKLIDNDRMIEIHVLLPKDVQIPDVFNNESVNTISNYLILTGATKIEYQLVYHFIHLLNNFHFIFC